MLLHISDSIKHACTVDTWAILLMLLGAFLLGLLLGYLLWYAYKKLVTGLRAEIDELKAKLVDMEKDAASLNYKYDELNKDYAAIKMSLSSCDADKVILQNKLDKCLAEAASGSMSAAATTSSAATLAAAAATSKKGKEKKGGAGMFAGIFKEDNLQIIEGIGPKVEKTLHNAGITSWAELAGKSHDDLRGILDSASKNFKICDPTTWPKQAALARDGKWDELIEYQKFLDTGRDTTGDFETDSKFEKLALKLMGPKATPEDLKIIEGVGPKIESLLKAAGFNNWADVAAASKEALQKVLDDAGSRYRMHDPTTWSKQAELARDGKWDELEEYQDFLQGGKA